MYLHYQWYKLQQIYWIKGLKAMFMIYYLFQIEIQLQYQGQISAGRVCIIKRSTYVLMPSIFFNVHTRSVSIYSKLNTLDWNISGSILCYLVFSGRGLWAARDESAVSCHHCKHACVSEAHGSLFCVIQGYQTLHVKKKDRII